MSKHDAIGALDRMNGNVVFMAPQYGGLSRDMQELASAPVIVEAAVLQRRRDEVCEAYGYQRSAPEKPFAYADGIAIIPVHGTLINRFSYSWSFATGYRFIRNQMNAALDDDDVKLIVFDINSYGGEAAGCFELAEEIAEARAQKSLLAVVDSNCCSAAYAIASGCSQVIVTPSGQAGSIGVIAVHVSYQKMLDNDGVEVTIFADMAHKGDGNPYKNLSEEVAAEFQAAITKRANEFIALIAKNRNIDEESIRATESRSYRADEALTRRLIDKVAPPAKAVAAFLGELIDEAPAEEEDDMSAATPAGQAAAAPAAAAPPAAAPTIDQAALNSTVGEAVAKALREDRERASAITSCEEAKDRPKLAQSLANAGFSLDQAKVALAAAAKEVTSEAGAGKSAFEQQMDAGGGAGVEANGSAGGGDAAAGSQGGVKPNKAQTTLAAMHGPEEKK